MYCPSTGKIQHIESIGKSPIVHTSEALSEIIIIGVAAESVRRQ